jgi:hypothetical protein
MADAAFRRFMKTALEPVAQPIERMRNAQTIDDLTDSDLLTLLRKAMLKEGVKPLGQADNLHNHLRARVARREQRHG